MRMVFNSDDRKKLLKILKQGNVIQSILNHQLKSMTDDLEHTFLICNGKVHPIQGKDSTIDSTVYLNNKRVDKICKNNGNRIYFHTHSNFFSDPSLIDYDAFNIIFKLPKVGFACNTGSDGLFCINQKGEEITIPWNFQFDDKFLKNHNHNRIEYGDTVFCNRQNDIYDCKIQWRSYARSLGKFKHVLMNSSTVALNDMGTSLGNYTHHPREIIKCLVSNSHNREVLLCKTIDGENIIGGIKDGKPPDPACSILDFCQVH